MLLLPPGRFTTKKDWPSQPLAYQARRDVGDATSGNGNNDAHWPRWIGLRSCDP
jgi:hypothetical protein